MPPRSEKRIEGTAATISRAGALGELARTLSDIGSARETVTTAPMDLEKKIHIEGKNQASSATPNKAGPVLLSARPRGLTNHQNGPQTINLTNAHKNKNATKSLMSLLTK